MENVVYSHLGASSRKVKVGPGRGLDNAVLSVAKDAVMIVTVDPVSAIPAFGMTLSAWLSVHLIASDLTSSGVDPEFAVFSYNFPQTMTAPQKEEYLSEVGRECRRLGIAIAAGHTGAYPGGGYTVIGSGIMLALAREGGYVTPSMARLGDVILMTKHAAIEATASLALSFPEYVETKVGSRIARRAKSLTRLCTTVEDARAARKAGLRHGVTAMHDATEGGVLGALDEMAVAAGKAFEVDPSQVPVAPESAAVCEAFGLDPLATMGEGALLLACRPGSVEALEGAMRRADIAVNAIGVVKEGRGLVMKGGGRGRSSLEEDLYWRAYGEAVRRRLR